MSDEKLQNMTAEELQTMLGGANPEQALLLNTYLDEEKRWSSRLQALHITRLDIMDEVEEMKDELESAESELNSCIADVEQESGLSKFVCGIINRSTKKQKRMVKATESAYALTAEYTQILEELDSINEKYIEVSENPPELFRYELAMMGNKLFKPLSM